MHAIRNLAGGIINGLAYIGALGLFAIAVLVSIDVTVRFITGRPITGMFEFASVLLVAVTFLPMAAVLLNNQQLRVDIVTEHLKPRASAIAGLLDVAIGLTVFGLLLLIATEEVSKAYFGRFLLRGLIEIPTWIPNAMIWVGALLSVVALLLKGVDSIRTLLSGATDHPTDPHSNPGAM